MEVHHHSHTSRKKWTHYFWEFLMLFLAVFCSFLAEYQLEHKIEKDREKQFMKSLLVDLEKDKRSLEYSVSKGPRIVQYSDSLLDELRKRPLEGREKKIYYFLAIISDGVTFSYYDRTVSQLRYSGGFRLLSKTEVSNALLDYDVLMREALSYATSIESWSFVSPAIQKSAMIFDIGAVFRIREAAQRFVGKMDSIPFPTDLKLMRYDDLSIKEYSNVQYYAQLTDHIKLDYSIKALEKNRSLDSLIRKEYHIKK